MDDVDRSRFVVMEEKYGNGKSRKVFLNGTDALYNQGKLSGYNVKPYSYYYGCTMNTTEGGNQMQRCWNDTIREFMHPLSDNPSPFEIAITPIIKEYTLGQNSYRYYYANGTIAEYDSYNYQLIRYIQKPTSFFVNYQSNIDSQNNSVTSFDNGTTVTYFSFPNMSSSLYDNATWPQRQIDFGNGTLEINYMNGTHVRITDNGVNSTKIDYLSKAAVIQIIQDGDKIIQKLGNNVNRTFYPPPAFDASEYDIAVAANFSDSFSNGTMIVQYFNGSRAIYNNDSFYKWA